MLYVSFFLLFWFLFPFLLILISFDLILIHIHTSLIRIVTSSWVLSMWKVSHTYMMTFNSTKDNIKRVSLKYKLLSLKSMVNHHTLHISHMFSTYQTHIFYTLHRLMQHTLNTHTPHTLTHIHHTCTLNSIHFLIRFSGILWFTSISFPTDFGITKTNLWFIHLSWCNSEEKTVRSTGLEYQGNYYNLNDIKTIQIFQLTFAVVEWQT